MVAPMDSESKKPSEPTFAPFPTEGIWTAIGLSRAAFFVIFLGASALYVFWGGPLWSHLGEEDFQRIVVSYTVIPVAVGFVLFRSGTLSLGTFLAATGVIAALKLLLTAVLALLFDL